MLLPQLQKRMRAPRRGVIKLGVLMPNKSGAGTHPEEVPYFVLPDDLDPYFHDHEGGKPTSLAVLFPFPDAARVLTTKFKRYAGGGPGRPGICTLMCDGERFVEWPTSVKGQPPNPPREGVCCRVSTQDWAVEQLDEDDHCGAEAKGRLAVMLVDGPLGVYEINIGGEQRIADLWTDLQIYQECFGTLTGIVFELRRVPTPVTITTDTGARLVRDGWPVRAFCAAATRQAIAFRGSDVRQLPGGQALSAQIGPAALIPALAERAGEAVGQDDDVEWDITRCFGWAVEHLGVTAEEYAGYLLRKYRHDHDNMTVEEMAEQERLLRKAAQDEQARKNLSNIISRGRVRQ